MSAIETRNSQVWLGADGIVRVIKKHGTEENLQDAIEVVNAIREVTDGKKVPVMVSIRGVKSQSSEAQEYYASDMKDLESVCALVVGADDNTELANEFLDLHKPHTTTQSFPTEEAALRWLRTFVDNSKD